MAKTARRFGSVIIGQEKFGSRRECRSLRSARVIASWTDDQGLISPGAEPRPGRVDCFLQHTVKIGEQNQQHVFALVDWHDVDEDKEKHGSPWKFGKRHFFLGVHLAIFQWQESIANSL